MHLETIKTPIMTDFNLITYMQEELRRTPTAFRRYMYDHIFWDDRMIGLV